MVPQSTLNSQMSHAPFEVNYDFNSAKNYFNKLENLVSEALAVNLCKPQDFLPAHHDTISHLKSYTKFCQESIVLIKSHLRSGSLAPGVQTECAQLIDKGESTLVRVFQIVARFDQKTVEWLSLIHI